MNPSGCLCCLLVLPTTLPLLLLLLLLLLLRSLEEVEGDPANLQKKEMGAASEIKPNSERWEEKTKASLQRLFCTLVLCNALW